MYLEKVQCKYFDKGVLTLLHQLYSRDYPYLSTYVFHQILCISGLNGRSTCKVILIFSPPLVLS